MDKGLADDLNTRFAVYDALGIRIKRLPITAEKIAMAIREGLTEVD